MVQTNMLCQFLFALVLAAASIEATAVDCVVTDFSSWTKCSKSCGQGFSFRTRSIKTASANNGAKCPKLDDFRICNTGHCPSDCAQEPLVCGQCSKTCGGGTKVCTRKTITVPTFGGKSCGPNKFIQKCNFRVCAHDCVAGPLGAWDACSKTCGQGGIRFRRRTLVVAPKAGGKRCPDMVESAACFVKACPIDCQVSQWESWAACSKTCGYGSKTRQRRVLLDALLAGKPCPPLRETAECKDSMCPSSCDVSSWSQWAPCSKSCGSGTKLRLRTVTKAGVHCPSLQQAEKCNTNSCYRDCKVGTWSNWSVCSRSCQGGVATRVRAIVHGPVAGGKLCPPVSEANRCNQHVCPVDCAGTPWVCNPCSVTCGGGSQSCSRGILHAERSGGRSCVGLALKTSRVCSTQGCPIACQVSTFSAWSSCSRSCGAHGVMTKRRSIVVSPKYGGTLCPPLSASKACNTVLCPADCKVTSWTSWTSCSSKCGVGMKRRTRAVLNYASHGGRNCPITVEMRQCDLGRCTGNCQVSGWGVWQQCTKSCGSGETKRSRTITHQPAALGTKCPHLTEKMTCNDHICQKLDCHVKHVRCSIVAGITHVTHDRTFMATRDQGSFHCARDGGQQCKCKCDRFPGCCYKKGVALSNGMILGSVYKKIEHYLQCCNMCSLHPQCGGWEYDTATKQCILKHGQPAYIASTPTMLSGPKFEKTASSECTISISA